MDITEYDWDRLKGLGFDEEFVEKAKGDLAGACWAGYTAVGMKPGKGGKMVPNCVPTKKKKKGTSDHSEISDGRIDPNKTKRQPHIAGPSAGSPSFNEYSEYIGGFPDELVEQFKEDYMDFRLVPAGGGMTIDVECDTNLPQSTPAELMEQKQRRRIADSMARAERVRRREEARNARMAKRRTKDLKKMQG